MNSAKLCVSSTLLCCCMYLHVTAQSWQLFPSQQYTFYAADGGLYQTIEMATPDSMVVSADTVFTWLHMMHADSTPYPCDAVLRSTYDFEYENVFPYIEHVVETGGWAYIVVYGGYDTISLNRFANPEETFDIGTVEDNNLYAKCESIAVEPVFGVMDSVRTYRIYKTGGDSDLDAEIKLSKSFGLLQFYDPGQLNWHANGENIALYSAIGIQSPESNAGWQPLSWLDFFPNQTGDILIWERVDTYPLNPDVYTYLKDSITLRTDFADSITFDINSWSKNALGEITFLGSKHEVYVAKDFIQMIERPGGYFIPATYQYFADPTLMLWHKNYYRSEMVGVDTTYKIGYSSGQYGLDTVDCFIVETVDLGYGFQMNNQYGIDYYSRSVGDASSYTTLIGGIMGGVAWGESDFETVSIFTSDKPQLLTIFPNPVQDFIQISSLPETLSEIRIYDITGTLVLSNQLVQDNRVDVSALPSGTYVLQCIAKQQLMFAQFVKW